MKTIPKHPSALIDGDGKILIVGAGGMLGWEATRFFRIQGLADRLVSLSRDKLDCSELVGLRKFVSELKPKIIFNAAAYTNVDLAETERERAWQGNVLVPKNLAIVAGEVGATLVHFSTDQVFDGCSSQPYREEESPNPLNYYAETKLAGEVEALKHPKTLLLRVQWLYGEKKDRFSPLKSRDLFTPFSDQYGAPTWTLDLMNVANALLSRGKLGIFHMAYDDFASWADVFSFVKAHWNLKVDLRPKTTREFTLPAKRPLFSVMSNAKLKAAIGMNELGSWKDSLREFLRIVGQ